eukprot:TRINITY_DN35656_c0_g1_i2.p1 TRINITY_DN35656_c0_g1~~TRINITY_DN35656_c0_g1_i2.p1  ORF type:complete len:280 (+),score=66.95 TRINITY_DN35656_c0_g1_i2:120-959(+)
MCIRDSCNTTPNHDEDLQNADSDDLTRMLELRLGAKVRFRAKAGETAGELLRKLTPKLGFPETEWKKLQLEHNKKPIDHMTTLHAAGIESGDEVEVRGVTRLRKAIEKAESEKAAFKEADFFKACKAGDVPKVLKYLEQHPALARAVDPKNLNRSGLHRSAALGNVTMAKSMLEADANPNLQDNELCTPLHIAAGCNQPEVLSLLLSAGADLGTTDKLRRTPLDHANKSKNSTVDSRKTIAMCDPDVLTRSISGMRRSATTPPPVGGSSEPSSPSNFEN